MRPPPLLVLTDRSQCSVALRDVVGVAVDCGARGVVLREKDLPERQRAALAADLRQLLAAVDGVLIVAGRSGTAGTAGTTDEAVHLAARDAFPRPRPPLVGRSCHGADEVAAALAEGSDYITLSPVFASRSKPGYGHALGVEGLAMLAGPGPPTYALGGVLPDDVPLCVAAGACGVAVMGPIMRRPQIAADYLAALAEMPR